MRLVWLSFFAAIAAIATSGCSFLPGFDVSEEALLYYLPVNEVSAQVSCEIQDFVDEYRIRMKDKKTTKWGLSSGDIAVTLTLQTNEGGFVNFTGVNVAKLGLNAFEAFIATTGTGRTAVPTLGAKLSPQRTKTITLKFAVPAVSHKSGPTVSEHCPGWAQNYTKRLFLKEWLRQYFKTINAREDTEKEIEARASQQLNPSCNLTANDQFLPVFTNPCIDSGVKMQSVDMKTQFKIAGDVSGGSTPALLGGGSVFLLPINGLGLDFNFDYTHAIDVLLVMCDNAANACSPEDPGILEDYSSFYEKQCHLYGLLNPILQNMKAPQDVCRRTDDIILTCVTDKNKRIRRVPSPRYLPKLVAQSDPNLPMVTIPCPHPVTSVTLDDGSSGKG